MESTCVVCLLYFYLFILCFRLCSSALFKCWSSCWCEVGLKWHSGYPAKLSLLPSCLNARHCPCWEVLRAFLVCSDGSLKLSQKLIFVSLFY